MPESSKARVADLDQRLLALDTTQSFIVQAPAGSGKTGLLTQRYLKLLGQVGAPEEIIAITFTRKAAAEMSSRILSALQQAQCNDPPQDDYERLTWQLARQALEQDRTRDWHLLTTPSRLRIMTIDSLSSWLARQLPVNSQFGAMPQIAERPDDLYTQAVHQTLQHLESEAQWSHAVERLITHLDNDLSLVVRLLVTMLSKREQWLRHIQQGNTNPQLRVQLENALARIVAEHLCELVQQMCVVSQPEFLSLINFAANNVDEKSPLFVCRDLTCAPEPNDTHRAVWMGFAELLLTKEGGWRKQINKTIGFPAPSAAKNKEEKALFEAMKGRLAQLLETLHEHEELRCALAKVRALPAVTYSQSQWWLLDALFELLPLVVAELYLVFAEHGCVDFSEIGRAACEALGDTDDPTDLALALDYRIQHIMVDEFQDTSFGQFQLLERLTAGWGAQDGRTLFLVGDPMQSIYRFREAEVGFFLWAQRHGIGALRLRELHLRVNFRSQAGVVDWVNDTFNDVFPSFDDIEEGAISYSVSIPFRSSGNDAAVEVYPYYAHEAAQEAQDVVALVQRIKRATPEQTIAVLVRARSHLTAIVAELKHQQVGYQAIDIDALSDKLVIQDLAALTRALLHPADSVAWLALLRGPCCGLTLQELELLAQTQNTTSVWQALSNQRLLAQLSAPARQRIARFHEVMTHAMEQRGRWSLKRLVQTTWLRLGGPATARHQAELNDAEVYLRLLSELEQTEPHVHWPLVAERIEKLYAKPVESAGNVLQLMTIHKSKGLEFDHVILPALGRKSPPDEKRLLLWLERLSEQQAGDLLLAPLHASGEQTDSIYRYLSEVDRAKLSSESSRLLYVAATRAKRKLYLFGHTSTSEKAGERVLRAPKNGSMLAKLWVKLENDFLEKIPLQDSAVDEGMPPVAPSEQLWRRLSSDWQLPQIADLVALPHSAKPAYQDEQVELLWQSPVARHVGSVVHEMLMRMSQENVQTWSPEKLQGWTPRLRLRLLQLGISPREIESALKKTLDALENVLLDERGQWILRKEQRQENYCEYALTGLSDERVIRVVIDRTFVDEQGVRWIIDYKTADYQGDDLAGFLSGEEKKYRRQLESYAQLLNQQTSRPTRLGLYFPLLQAWREWSV